MKLIDGKEVSRSIRDELKKHISDNNLKIGLAVVYVGDNPASKIYVTNKINACNEVGITSYFIKLDENVTTEELLCKIEELNCDEAVHGILVQLPLPKQINEAAVISSISVKKDVDGFSAYNLGRLAQGVDSICSCTPAGIIELLKYYKIPLSGKNATVIGRSNIVGKPMALLLLHENCTVTICHSRTQNLKEIAKNADIIVAAIGKANFVTKDFVKDGAVVIDVGINRENGKLCGDVKFDEVADNCSYITPVPGGVGPMTITMLLKNTVKAYELYGNR